MFQLHTVVTLTLLILILSSAITNGNNIDYEQLPLKSDLLVYLESFIEILYFSLTHKNDVDINYGMGHFLAGVNLKKAVLNDDDEDRIPLMLKINIMHLLIENDELMKFFGDMVENNNDPKDASSKLITSLIANETQWIENLRQFDLVLSRESKDSNTQFKGKNASASWRSYLQTFEDLFRWTPSPRLSDTCMNSLARNRVHKSITSKCKVEPPCYDMLLNGSDFGYALSHRLLFLLTARHARGCSIFSKHRDEALVHNYCQLAFNEAEFIAENNYGMVDLFMEHICLCSIAGYPQFLRRSWLNNILRYQTKYGCFGTEPPKASNKQPLPGSKSNTSTWKLSKEMDYTLMDGECDGHVTAVAIATLASAIRFILATYF